MKSRRWVLIGALTAALLGLGAFWVLWNAGVIMLNNPLDSEYPVRGVDVSAYQGEIDWPTLADQDIDFAFIKATEGSSFRDSRFEYNWAESQATHLRVGAYHFFSYDSAGSTQAENFIATVPVLESALPPVVDVESYGDKERNPPAREDVQALLNELLAALETHYGVKPILYATGKSYKMYIQGDYSEYPIWIRDVFLTPSLSDGRAWTFWQFTDRARLTGYAGEERFIDLNVFHGTAEEFAAFGS